MTSDINSSAVGMDAVPRPPAGTIGDPPFDPRSPDGIVFFPVSTTKLLVMSLCTWGVYEAYWYYRNWHLVRSRTGEKMWPIGRALFPFLFCYELFVRVRMRRPDLSSSDLAAGLLASGYILLYTLPKLFLFKIGAFDLISFATPILLLPVQRSVNTINHALAPGHDPNSRLTAWNWLLIVIGCAAAALVAIDAIKAH